MDDGRHRRRITGGEEPGRDRSDQQGFCGDDVDRGRTNPRVFSHAAHIHAPRSQAIGHGQFDFSPSVRIRDQRRIPVRGVGELAADRHSAEAIAAATDAINLGSHRPAFAGLRQRCPGAHAQWLVTIECIRRVEAVWIGQRKGGQIGQPHREFRSNGVALGVERL